MDKEVISSIGRGVLVFAAVAPGDSEKEAQQIANKVIKMKLWDDENGGRVSRAIPLSAETFSLFGHDLTNWPIVEEERRRYRRRSALW